MGWGTGTEWAGLLADVAAVRAGFGGHPTPHAPPLPSSRLAPEPAPVGRVGGGMAGGREGTSKKSSPDISPTSTALPARPALPQPGLPPPRGEQRRPGPRAVSGSARPGQAGIGGHGCPAPRCPPKRAPPPRTLAPPSHTSRSGAGRPASQPRAAPPPPPVALAAPCPSPAPGTPGGRGPRGWWGTGVRRVGRSGEGSSGPTPPPHKGPGAPAAILKTFLLARQLASPPPPPITHPRTPRRRRAPSRQGRAGRPPGALPPRPRLGPGSARLPGDHPGGCHHSGSHPLPRSCRAPALPLPTTPLPESRTG